MKKVLGFIIVIFCLFHLDARADCFIASENSNIVSEGDCKTRQPPQSTFKMAIALMGYNESVLSDESHPVFEYKKSFNDGVEKCKSPHDPAQWMKDSCVWFSQQVTKKIGMPKFKKYLKDFRFGNEDASGVKRKPDGLANSWISSSLKISPEEYIEFLRKFTNGKLPVSKKSMTYTKNILFSSDLKDGWKLYGKTGTGDIINSDGSHNKTRERGWFVGWAEKGTEKILFAQYLEIENIKKNGISYIASLRAREKAYEQVKKLIEK